MERKRAGAFLKDVAYRTSHGNDIVKVPLSKVGTYEVDGTPQAGLATLYLPAGRMTPNKVQEDVTQRRGWCALNPNHVYTLMWTEPSSESIHADRVRRTVRMTGAEIADENDRYGKPALKHAETEERRLMKKERRGPGQLSLFDDIPTMMATRLKETEKAPTIETERTPIQNDPADAEPEWMHDHQLFYDHDVDF